MTELGARADAAVAGLADCRACPRDCGVDRLSDRWSACKAGRHAVVSSCFPHLGEEDPLRGWRGSGTIFFAHCNLRCVFCQNWDISQGIRPATGAGVTPAELAALMLRLQDDGCHNINFVTPEHVVPQVLEALVVAVESGLRLPLVYNTSAYESPEVMALLDGVVDIYLPDFRYQDRDKAARYSALAENYPEVAAANIKEMHRQVGELELDNRGIAIRGLLILPTWRSIGPSTTRRSRAPSLAPRSNKLSAGARLVGWWVSQRPSSTSSGGGRSWPSSSPMTRCLINR